MKIKNPLTPPPRDFHECHFQVAPCLTMSCAIFKVSKAYACEFTNMTGWKITIMNRGHIDSNRGFLWISPLSC